MTDSLPLIKLRILAGAHAGGEVKLAAGTYSIGPQLESDIVISDWPHLDSTLSLRPDGASLEVAGTGGERQLFTMAPLAPLAVGALVLVAALASIEWPADMELLRALFDVAQRADDTAQPVAPVVASGVGVGRMTWFALLGAAIVTGVSVAVAAVGAHVPTTTDRESGKSGRASAVGALLDRAMFSEVSLVAEGDRLSLRGWVRDAAQADLLKRALAGDADVRHAYAIVEDVRTLISDRVGDPDARVLYRGQGAFAVAGRLRVSLQAQRAVDQIRAEMGASVASITLESTGEVEAFPGDGKSRSIVYLPDGQVIDATDGVKKFSSTTERAK
jgi:type III secretion protein D